MSARVFILRHGGGEDGPYAEEDVLDALAAGHISPDDRCRLECQALPQRVGDVFEFLASSRRGEGAEGERVGGNDGDGDEDDNVGEDVGEQEDVGEDEHEDEHEDREILLYEGSPSLLGYGWVLVAAAGVLAGGYWLGQFGVTWVVGALAISLLLVVRLLLHRGSREYVVTTRRVEAARGLVVKSTQSIALDDLGSIRLHRPQVLRWFGVGTVVFTSAGRADPDVVFERIGRVRRVISLVRERQRQAGRR